MFDDLTVNDEHEFARRLDEFMKRGDYEAMQELAESKAPTELVHAASHAMLCNVWRELNDAYKLAQHRMLGNACPDITEDLRKNMSRELMILCDKRGIYGTADGLWKEISTGTRDPAQRGVDMIGRMKSLYYRPGGRSHAKITLIETEAYIREELTKAEIIPQDILNLSWWGMQICAASGDDMSTKFHASRLVDGFMFKGISIPRDAKPVRLKLARLMLNLDRKPRWIFRSFRKMIISFARRWDMRH